MRKGMSLSQSEWIPLDKCENRHVYIIRSRNLLMGAFRQSVGGFIGIREKFGTRYLFEEYHNEASIHHGTVWPIEDIGVILPDDIELVEVFDGGCGTCGAPVEYHKELSGPFNQETKDWDTWPWVHVDNPEAEADHGGICAKTYGTHKTNQPLFDLLEKLEKQYC